MSEPTQCACLQTSQKIQILRRAGSWRLTPQRAMSLLPRKDSQLLIVQGTAWITLEKPLHHWARSDGDHFLQAGQTLHVPAGTRCVMESRDSQEDLYFDWRGMPPSMVAHRSAQASWPELFRQWLQALDQLAGASGRLVRGLCRSRLDTVPAGELRT